LRMMEIDHLIVGVVKPPRPDKMIGLGRVSG
jgi:hypothetical protein